MARFDFVRGDHEGDPRLNGAECATLDAGHLHVTCDGVTSHAQVMFEGRLGCIFDDLGRAVHDLGNEGGGHGRGDPDL